MQKPYKNFKVKENSDICLTRIFLMIVGIVLTKPHYVIISIPLMEFTISRPGVKLLLFPFTVVSLDGVENLRNKNH